MDRVIQWFGAPSLEALEGAVPPSQSNAHAWLCSASLEWGTGAGGTSEEATEECSEHS